VGSEPFLRLGAQVDDEARLQATLPELDARGDPSHLFYLPIHPFAAGPPALEEPV
jgi:hypothetical protein